MEKIIKRKLAVESVPLTSVRPHPKNVRLHSQENLDAIKASLIAFGQMKPIVVWKDNLIIAGCGTHESARQLSWETIQIVRVDYLSENAAMEYLIADNKTTDMSEFDFDQLAVVMSELKAAGSSLTATGFSEEEAQTLVEGKLFTTEDIQGQEEELGARRWTVSFTDDEWMEIIQKFVQLTKMDATLKTPEDLVKVACASCQVEFVRHCVKCFSPQKPRIQKKK